MPGISAMQISVFSLIHISTNGFPYCSETNGSQRLPGKEEKDSQHIQVLTQKLTKACKDTGLILKVTACKRKYVRKYLLFFECLNLQSGHGVRALEECLENPCEKYIKIPQILLVKCECIFCVGSKC